MNEISLSLFNSISFLDGMFEEPIPPFVHKTIPFYFNTSYLPPIYQHLFILLIYIYCIYSLVLLVIKYEFKNTYHLNSNFLTNSFDAAQDDFSYLSDRDKAKLFHTGSVTRIGNFSVLGKFLKNCS